MTKGLPRSLRRGPALQSPIRKQTISLKQAPIVINGATGVGFGTTVIGDFPEGNVLLLGAVANLSIAGPGNAAGLGDTWEGDYGIGSTPAGDATLTGDDVNIIQSTALAAATAEVSPVTRGTSAQANIPAILDNTDGSLEINLSALIDDADISADNIACTATGEVYLSYVMLGDD